MSNKSVRQMMEKIYGKRCMCCKGIRKIHPPKPRKAKFKGKSIENQLTYHHIVPLSQNGDTSIENGAVLCRSCHTLLEELPQSQRDKVNDELRRYKEGKCQVVFVDDLSTDYVIIPTEISFKSEKKPKEPYDRAKKKQEDLEKINEYYEK